VGRGAALAVKALVTGGGGFLGRALVERLVRSGHDVTAAARGDYPGLRELGVRTLRMDLADSEAVRTAVAGRDVVFHAAAMAGVWGPKEEFVRTNVTGTRNVVEACRSEGVPRLVHTSSPSVVFDGRDQEGAGPELPYAERFDAFYPETKAAAERIVLEANGPGLATVALRPHLIWGPRDPHLLPRLLARAKAGRLFVVGDGRNRVGLTYVENAAAAHEQAASRLEPGAPCAGRAYFVHDLAPVELWPWLDALVGRLGLPRIRHRVPETVARAAGLVAEVLWRALPLPGEPPMTRFVAAQLARSHWYDMEPARRAFGYAPPVAPAEALDITVAYWREALGRPS
jgi:2-alkyl-3-oxoalkanoate reductase